MGDFYLWVSLQFVSVFVLGLPFSAAFMMRDKAPQSLGWLMLSPAFGATLYFSAGTILHFCGLRAFAVFWALVAMSAGASITLLRCQRGPPPGGSIIFILGCFVAAVFALALNSSDLRFAGLDYFPLTNDDTFTYLGYIDQIRNTGWITPRITYPAGYVPLIDSAVSIRAPSVIFSADFADILGLETHSAFFLSQRMALPIIALGASGIVMIATGNWMATSLCFAPLVFGNVLLHQIFQQFNSSTMGTVIGPVIVALAIWTVRRERSGSEVVAGHVLAGWACGTMAITSVEAHPFYLMAFGLVALIPIFRDRQLKQVVKCGGAFTGAYLAASFPFVIKAWTALISQFVNAGNGHPGDWIATSGFLVQATGVTFTTNARLLSYPFVPLVTAVAVLTVFLAAIAVLGRSVTAVGEPERVLRTDRFALFCIVLLVTVLQLTLYVRGVGYGLLKLTDYFAFLGSVVIAVAAFQFGLTRLAAGRALPAAFVAYCLVGLFEKQQHILESYGERTARAPLPLAYKLDDKAVGGTVSADLSAEPLNLFLYENRYQAVQILLRPSESNRFGPLRGSLSAAPQYLARMQRASFGGTTVADITYPAVITPEALTVMPAAGQIHLLLPDPHWLTPEGEDGGRLRRWLSVSGKFVIFGPLADRRRLDFEVAAGPDLRPDNQIEIYLAGQLLQSVAPNEVPVSVHAPLTMQIGPEAEGEIRIIGPARGIRQISLAQLRTVPR